MLLDSLRLLHRQRRDETAGKLATTEGADDEDTDGRTAASDVHRIFVAEEGNQPPGSRGAEGGRAGAPGVLLPASIVGYEYLS